MPSSHTNPAIKPCLFLLARVYSIALLVTCYDRTSLGLSRKKLAGLFSLTASERAFTKKMDEKCNPLKRRKTVSVGERDAPRYLRTRYAYECKFLFGRLWASERLFVTRSRTYTARYSYDRYKTSARTYAQYRRGRRSRRFSLSIPCAASSASTDDSSRFSFSPAFHPLPSRSIFHRPRGPCTLPQLSATVISRLCTFVRVSPRPGRAGTCCLSLALFY